MLWQMVGLIHVILLVLSEAVVLARLLGCAAHLSDMAHLSGLTAAVSAPRLVSADPHLCRPCRFPAQHHKSRVDLSLAPSKRAQHIARK
jgi:hypothetical protein